MSIGQVGISNYFSDVAGPSDAQGGHLADVRWIVPLGEAWPI
jgi:hypothetical protein